MDDDNDNYEEWTMSKRKVNHKTRQVETRVSRQLLVENGKVIADSGPQVTTRIKEDNKVEECEKEKTPKNKSKFEALESAPEGPEGATLGGRVLGEKKEIQRVSREVREENLQYHDERFKELTGRDVHQKAIRAPHELITISDKHHAADSAPRGKMVHYSNRGKKYQDTDEILEVAKVAVDGSITKEVKRTHNHEEFSEDEKPDETGEAEELRHKPVVQRSSRRHVDYVNDYDDVRTPDASDNDEREEYDSRRRQHKPLTASSGGLYSTRPSSKSHASKAHRHDDSDEAFPRYDMDPLLNSLRDEDYRPAQSGGRVKEVSLERRQHAGRRRGDSVSSSDLEQEARGRGRTSYRTPSGGAGGHKSPAHSVASGRHSQAGGVEIPDMYRVNKQRLLAGKTAGGGASSREQSYSPQRHERVVQSASSASRARGRHSAREDAATQAHLTDEEIERQSIRSSLTGAGAGEHARTTQHLQRQSTPNASRRYYYGNAQAANTKQAAAAGGNMSRKAAPGDIKRRGSVTSSSSSSISLDDDPKSRARQQGARSRDSGFRSPTHHKYVESPELKKGAATYGQEDRPAKGRADNEQQIYSVSSKSARKSARRDGAVSPALTTGSAGQRSVKTTTTTVGAGLAERPESRASLRDKKEDIGTTDDDEFEFHRREAAVQVGDYKQKSLDTISVSSLKGPSATKIKVPYRHMIEIQQGGRTQMRDQQHKQRQQHTEAWEQNPDAVSAIAVEKLSASSEMSFQDDIESLSKRLANISKQQQQQLADQEKPHFDYTTLVANVQSAPHARRQQVLDAYHVRLEQNSPFQQQQQQPLFKDNNNPQEQERQLAATGNLDNNNETNFHLSDYHVKYRATPALVDESSLLTCNNNNNCSNNERASGKMYTSRDDGDDGHYHDDDDRMSQVSSRTYKIRTIAPTTAAAQDEGEGETSASAFGRDENDLERASIEFDENGNSKKPAAWIYDPRDGSSTAIVPPARPKRPETPKVDAKTEELVQARGGRSYYLELVEKANKKANENAARRQRPGSMESVYSRWNSQGALNSAASSSQIATYRPLAAVQLKSPPPSQYKSTKQINSTIARQEQDRMMNKSTSNINTTNSSNTSANTSNQRRQLPFGGAPASLGDKSKSSSCLLSVTKPSKYSIYGGFRRPGENNKPVPRLSYSRAIGPRSQRIDSQPKPMPSRYLKMR